MLPNWLYGKSKSKLASILGGGGTPEDYNQTINRNLLDNPWFTVNQRGESSYSESTGYAVDRWKVLYMAGNVTITNNGLDITTSVEGYFVQYIEENLSTLLLGKTVTLSALVDGVIYKVTGIIPDTFPTAETGIMSVKIGSFYLALQLNATRAFIMIFGTGTVNNIRAVKLELGSVSTLAMDTAPDYQQELAKCQRYYIGGKLESLYAYKASGRINAFMLLPVTMRSTPVIVGTPGIYSLDDNSAISGATIESPLELYSNGVKFPISGANDTLCRVFIPSGSGLSADL